MHFGKMSWIDARFFLFLFSYQAGNMDGISQSETRWDFQNGIVGRRQKFAFAEMLIHIIWDLGLLYGGLAQQAHSFRVLISTTNQMGNGMAGELIYKLYPERT